MSYVIDTNVLARSIEESHPMHQDATGAIGLLIIRGETLCILPQNLYEFWVVATRPRSQNGLGLGADEAKSHLDTFESIFSLLPDIPAIYAVWKALVVDHAVLGKLAHDARIVAAMSTHGLNDLLTFNTDDFKRFTDVSAISPTDLGET